MQELVFPTDKTRPHHSISFFGGEGGVGKFGQCKNLFSPLIKQGRTIQFLFLGGEGCKIWSVQELVFPTDKTRPHHSISFLGGEGGGL